MTTPSWMDLSRLRDPFPAEDIEWRVQQAGERNGKVWARVLAYVTNRAIQARLDDVCGPENWRNEFAPAPCGGVMCGISIRCGDEWVTKWDGAENTDIEAVKGGLSGAMKRAAVQWGIGRYLYQLEEGWANVHEGGQHRAQTKDKKWFRWDPPALPAWALPDGVGKPNERPVQAQTASSDDGSSPDVGSRTRQVPGDVRLPTCPNCGGPVWDNRLKKASGEFKPTAPDFKCRRKDCDGAIWPDSERTLADENERKDNIVAAIQSAINQIKGMSAEDGDAAQKVLDGYLQRERVTVEQLVRLQTNIQGKLDALMEEAKMATAGRTYENFSQPFPEPADDGLPF